MTLLFLFTFPNPNINTNLKVSICVTTMTNLLYIHRCTERLIFVTIRFIAHVHYIR